MLPKNTLSLQQKVQKRLHIKYVNAKQLTEQAINEFKLNPELVDLVNDEDIVEEVVRLFNLLSKQEQDDMMMSSDIDIDNNDTPEPEWKRKARIAALKREAEWQLQLQQQGNDKGGIEGGGKSNVNNDNEPLQPGQSKTVSTTTTTSSTTITKGPTTTTTDIRKKEGKWRSIKKSDMPPEYQNNNNDKDDNNNKTNIETKQVTCCIM